MSHPVLTMCELQNKLNIIIPLLICYENRKQTTRYVRGQPIKYISATTFQLSRLNLDTSEIVWNHDLQIRRHV